MFIINWFKKVLENLNFFKKEAKVVFLGLENAGKSSLLIRLKYDRFSQIDPTVCVHSEEIEVGRVKFKAFDMGGHDVARKIWEKYFVFAGAIIYMVDSTHTESLGKAREELWKVLSDERVQKVPILVFGNKIDKKGALGEDELKEALGLDKETLEKNGLKNRNLELFMCSVALKSGILDGFKWLNKQI
jgi:GTP-binding protein SAR1